MFFAVCFFLEGLEMTLIGLDLNAPNSLPSQLIIYQTIYCFIIIISFIHYSP